MVRRCHSQRTSDVEFICADALTLSAPVDTVMYVSSPIEAVITTHQIGTPFFVHLSSAFGACPF